ncbi:unnamed protein product [Sphagnum tenellum]
MSKSRGNVINPDHVIEKYGADTLRVYEMFMGPLERDKPWSTHAIEGSFVSFKESGVCGRGFGSVWVKSHFLFFEPWPTFDLNLAKDDQITIAVQVMGKTRGTLEVAPGTEQLEVEREAKNLASVASHLAGLANRPLAEKICERLGKTLGQADVRRFSDDASVAMVDKRRTAPNVAKAMNIIGEVEGKTAIVLDDMIDTAGGRLRKLAERSFKKERLPSMRLPLTEFFQALQLKGLAILI